MKELDCFSFLRLGESNIKLKLKTRYFDMKY